MNKQKLASSIIFLFSLFLVFSCTNEPVDPVLATQLATSNGSSTGGIIGGGVFKADFNGQTWVATTASANIFNGKIDIAGLKGTQDEGFGFSLNGNITGSYSSSSNLFAYSLANSSGSYLGFNPNNPSEIAGSVIINSIDSVNHTISGTFSFKGYWSDSSVTNITPINFTNGTFTNIPYTTINPVTDTFYAKVDGTEFIEDKIDVATVISQGFPDSYSIVASKINGDNLGLRISKSLNVGTYQFTGPLALDLALSYLVGGVLYSVDSGSLIITSKSSTHMEGTFNLIVKNFTSNQTKTISQGAFSVDLP
ncbi:MAG: DUF6252 family protein [Flavobacterium sp.]